MRKGRLDPLLGTASIVKLHHPLFARPTLVVVGDDPFACVSLKHRLVLFLEGNVNMGSVAHERADAHKDTPLLAGVFIKPAFCVGE